MFDQNQDFTSIRSAEPERDGLLELPALVLDQQVLFPKVLSLIPLSAPASLEAVRYARQRQQTLIAIQCKIDPSGSELRARVHSVGTEIAPGQIIKQTGSAQQVMVQGRRRLEIVAMHKRRPYPVAKARVITDKAVESAAIESHRASLLELFQRASQYRETLPDTVIQYILSVEEPGQLCDSLASILPIDPNQSQRLLEQADIEKRLEQLASLLASDLQQHELRQEVHSRLQDEMAASQREMYLREQLRIIQQELGESDVFQQELRDLSDKIHQAKLPPEAHSKAMKELSRLGAIPSMSPESGLIHTYLERLLALPWHAMSEENLDLRQAEAILEQSHYGLDKVKTRIAEHIAVRKLAQDKMKSPILCFVGPPGAGKTSLGKSIAAALGRQFLRISLGGVRDEAEIRGHRRTYIGAMPGQILQQMQRAETINPVFMLDEIDKMSSDFRGDPTAALLEVLDPEQNQHFADHYLEIPYDLSKVTFITTANDLYALPQALEDRLEVIEFKGYSEEEKIQIADRFLIPKQLEANGIKERGIRFHASGLRRIIRHYTYESGVRNLEREIARMCRKIARRAASDRAFPRRISPAVIEKHLGPPPMVDLRVNRKDAIGIVSGLVWTPHGGEVQTIEASLLPGKGSLTLTGQLGDVLQESAQIALSCLRSRARDFGLPPEDFENCDIHIHMPEGAVPKEGPSAGIALAAALVSAFTEAPARSDFAMTGEITLRGHILPVGGIAEKVLAARRRGIPHILLPKDNEKDLRDLPKAVIRDVSIRLVENMQEVIDLMLHEPPAQRQRDLEADARQRESSSEADG